MIDTTGSMWDDIAGVKAAAIQIVNTLENETPGYRVAIADYRDFPVSPYGGSGDYPYHPVLPFSQDKATIISGIQSLSLGWGGETGGNPCTPPLSARSTPKAWENGAMAPQRSSFP
ncbi:MAG: vWA domain-containing protein [Bacillota bacterium]